MYLLKMFSRAWILTTLLVLAGSALCVRLGIWQLDRLEQRRAFNQQVISMRAAPALNLNEELPTDLTSMEWRAARVSGEYDFENQFAIRNQVWNGQYGFHLITPLKFSGGVILVNRGFIPFEGNDSPEGWRRYAALGAAVVEGQIRLGNDVQIGGKAEANLEGQNPIRFWNSLELPKISAQIPYSVLPVYLQPNEDPADSTYPVPQQPEVDLTEGSHFGYALQWFSFAAILFFGYPFYLRKQITEQEQ
ncbi:MAG: SURF1 family protein [Anaerolineales bacterium]